MNSGTRGALSAEVYAQCERAVGHWMTVAQVGIERAYEVAQAVCDELAVPDFDSHRDMCMVAKNDVCACVSVSTRTVSMMQ